MKRISAITFFAMAGLIMLGSALAQAQGVRAQVPFDFIVGKQVLPAGAYRVFIERSFNGSKAVLIQSEDRHITAVNVTSVDENGSVDDNKLVFAKYGDQYFLHEVRCSAESRAVEFPISKLEKRASAREAQLQNSGRIVAALK